MLCSKFVTRVILACVASVSVGLEAKKDRGTGFSVFCLRRKWGDSLLPNLTETLATQARVIPTINIIRCDFFFLVKLICVQLIAVAAYDKKFPF